MKTYIQAIKGPVPHTNKEVDITLDGRSLIITGGNGSGKTSLLDAIHKNLIALISIDDIDDIDGLVGRLMLSIRGGKDEYGDEARAVRELEEIHRKMFYGIQTELNYKKLSSNIDNNKAIIRYYIANRRASITEFKSPSSSKIKKNDTTTNFGQNLEQHLVNMRTRRSFAITEDKNEKLVEKITKWFENFEQNLKTLMEDESTKLTFGAKDFKFIIEQKGKDPFTFQTLSSGYSAIFDIFADLLMRTELFDVSPLELGGVVLIDEIDAHLHVSLQRKILPFFCNSFPTIQFIVTAHSPFVLSSVDNVVVYDLNTLEQFDGSLSMYSYESIIQGLLGVHPLSENTQKNIQKLAHLVTMDPPDFQAIRPILDSIKPHQEQLDAESEMLYQQAVNKVLMHKLEREKE